MNDDNNKTYRKCYTEGSKENVSIHVSSKGFEDIGLDIGIGTCTPRNSINDEDDDNEAVMTGSIFKKVPWVAYLTVVLRM